MLDGPLVSVVMSVYNDEKYLEQAIKSILSQTFTNFEFIVVDDGSLDRSKNIIIELRKADSRIIFIDRAKNMGLPYSLNEGLAVSKGKYIARMDSDDIALPNRFEKQVLFLEKRIEVDIVGAQVRHIDSSGGEVRSATQPLSFDDIKSIAEFACPINHPTYMVKREAYKKLGGYREDFIYAQDYDFILRAIDSDFIVENMPDVVLKYRDVQSESPSTKTHRQLYLGRQAIRLHKERVRYGVESGETLEKVKKSSFLAGFLFSSSLKLRKATLRAELPSLLKYIFAFVSSVLHYEVFYDSVRGFRLKAFRARKK